jgi:DNA-directed RNA polymerase subunit N (RpoN/RPB10)
MKERYCFECGKELNWSGFKFQNANLSEDYLKKLWDHNSIELYCCECFKDEMLLEKGIVSFPDDFIKKGKTKIVE